MSEVWVPIGIFIAVAVGIALWALWKYRSELARRMHLERYIDNLMPYTEPEPASLIPTVAAVDPGNIVNLDTIEEEEEPVDPGNIVDTIEEEEEPVVEPEQPAEPAPPMAVHNVVRIAPEHPMMIRAEPSRVEEIEDLPAPNPVVDDDAELIAAAEAAAATPRRSRRGQRS
jgi:hypothetical protein